MYNISMQGLVTKIGPWGGIDGGRAQDITATPKRLESITIHSGWTIDSISFIYFDQAGEKHRAGPWGGPGGDPCTVSELPLQFLFNDSHLGVPHSPHHTPTINEKNRTYLVLNYLYSSYPFFYVD